MGRGSILDAGHAEYIEQQLANGPPHIQALYHRIETFASALSFDVVHWANPKSYIGFYHGGDRGTQFFQIKIRKRGVRVVLVPDCIWFDPLKILRRDGGRQDRAYQNALIQGEAELPYVFLLIAQAYAKKLNSW